MISINYRLALPLLILATLSACRASDPPPATEIPTVPAPADCTVDSQNIQEAALRFMMVHHVRLPADSYYLRVDGKDPSSEFLNRFLSTGITVYPASARPTGGLGAPPTPGSAYKMDGPLGMLYSVGGVVCTGFDTAEVTAGYHCGFLCAAGLTTKLSRRSGRWVVIEQTIQWIS